MAQATGSITFSGLPTDYTKIALDDGQGTPFSKATLHVVLYSGNGLDAISGSTANNAVQEGNASNFVNIYKRYSTNKAFMYISFNHDGQTNATFQDFATGGSTPLIYEFTDSDGNVVNVTLVNESSGFTTNVASSAVSRKDSAGNYSINVNNSLIDADNIAEELKDILAAARSAGELNINVPRRDSTYYLFFGTDDAGDSPMSFRVKRASGTWTQTSKAAAHISKDDHLSAGHRIANIYGTDEVVYSVRNSATGGSGTLTTNDFASYVNDMINGLHNFQISSSVSSGTISLTNDNHGTEGNITITTSNGTNISLEGMAGGSASGGGGLATTASAAITAAGGGELSAGGTSGSPEATLVIATGSLSADTTIELSLATDADPATNGLNEGAINATAYSKVVRVTPHGTQFSSAAQITFNLSGTVEGTCPSNLQIWKRGNADSPWYRLPSNLWTCESGSITINTTSFSDYQAIGGETMARTKLNNIQLARLEQANKILPDAINITGSLSSLVTTVADSDVFILQKADTETSQHVSASTLQSYFSTLSVENSAEDVDMYLTFVSGAGSQTITIDGSSASGSALRYNPYHDLLSGKNVHLGGYLEIDGAITGSGGAMISGGVVNIDAAVDIDVPSGLDFTVDTQGDGADILLTAGGGGDIVMSTDGGGFASLNASTDILIGNSNGTPKLGRTGATTEVLGPLSGSSTLSIAGASELEGTLNVEGAVDFDSTLIVGGTATMAAISGSSTLSIAGASELEGTLNVEGAVDLDSTLDVGGAISGSSTLDVAGAVELNSTLRVVGASDLDGSLDVAGAISGSSTLEIGGAVEFDSTMRVAGNSDLDGTLDVAGAVNLADNLTVEGNLTVNGTTTQIDTQNLLVEDPIIVLADGNGAATVDQGFVFTRGGVTNHMFLWDESEDHFALVSTSEDGTTSGSVSITDYSAFKVGDITGSDATFSGDMNVDGTITGGLFSGDGSGLTGVGASVDETSGADLDLQIPFTTGSAAAAKFFIESGSLTFNPSSNLLKVDNINATGSSALNLGPIGDAHKIQISSDAVVLNTPSGQGNTIEFQNGGFVAGEIETYTFSGVANKFKIKTTTALELSGSSVKVDTEGGLEVIDGPISGSGTLIIGGASELEGTLNVEGAVDFDSTLDVVGAISGSSTLAIGGAAEFDSTMRVAGNADLDGTLDVAGAISGSSTLDVAGAVELNSTLRVVGAADLEGALDVAGAISGSSTLSIAGNSELEGTLNVEGAVDLDSTLNVDGAVTFGSVADLTIDVGDETHYMVVTDSDDNVIKRATLASFVSASATALGAGDGIQVSNGQLSVQFRELIATRYSTGSVLSDDYVTASFPSSEEPLSGSLQVYLNGMLLVGSGSVNVAASDPIFDYKFLGSAGSRRVEFLTAVDPDDVIQIKYIRK